MKERTVYKRGRPVGSGYSEKIPVMIPGKGERFIPKAYGGEDAKNTTTALPVHYQQINAGAGIRCDRRVDKLYFFIVICVTFVITYRWY